jgi:hypothetical protein
MTRTKCRASADYAASEREKAISEKFRKTPPPGSCEDHPVPGPPRLVQLRTMTVEQRHTQKKRAGAAGALYISLSDK